MKAGVFRTHSDEPQRRARAAPWWAAQLRDRNTSWMKVAQKGVEAFVGQAMGEKVPFATETVFSHWVPRADGTVESKIDNLRKMQAEGYFTLLIFVGLANVELSIARVATRVEAGGHAVSEMKLRQRFRRTQQAIRDALDVADASLLVDNSRDEAKAFMVCRLEFAQSKQFDLRSDGKCPGHHSPMAGCGLSADASLNGRSSGT